MKIFFKKRRVLAYRLPGFYKSLYASVISFLNLFGKKASGQFAAGPVIGHTLAADALLRA
jgi:hypothetical protein